MLNPALVTQRAAQRLPRLALLIFCAAYVLPGIFGRAPWKNADITAVGYMLGLARGESSWLSPSIAGLPGDGSVLPYWIGAFSIRLLDGWLEPALAARLPFALLLIATLALLWYGCFHLARTEAAQPLAFAFGGEAQPVDYARAIADGALLGLIASLGLLQLGHETTPELVQLTAVALYLYGLAAAPHRVGLSRAATLCALPMLAASGAATTAVLMALAGTVLAFRSTDDRIRASLPWIIASGVIAAGVATLLDAWVWRLAPGTQGLGLPKLMAWFCWPVWPLAAWTVWQWRRQLGARHLAIPLASMGVALLSSVAMGASDRALMLALPAMAVLAAFALPTLQRSVSAAIDWFSVFFFSVCALAIWVIYVAMQTGVPPKPAANVAKLAPGFVAQFSAPALLLALAGSLAWIWLVSWRTGRHRPALWKSLVLPAGGVALSWLLLMTLWLPLLDYARSYQPMFARLARIVPAKACVQAPTLNRAQLAAIKVYTGWKVRLDAAEASPQAGAPRCDWLLVERREPRNQPAPASVSAPEGWRFVARVQRPADRVETIYIYRRQP